MWKFPSTGAGATFATSSGSVTLTVRVGAAGPPRGTTGPVFRSRLKERNIPYSVASFAGSSHGRPVSERLSTTDWNWKIAIVIGSRPGFSNRHRSVIVQPLGIRVNVAFSRPPAENTFWVWE